MGHDLVYRNAGRAGAFHIHAKVAGREAILAAHPEIDPAGLSQIMQHALCWCASNHPDWLKRGVPKREWIWPPDHRGSGQYHRNPEYEDV